MYEVVSSASITFKLAGERCIKIDRWEMPAEETVYKVSLQA